MKEISIYKNETWYAYKPGKDKVFKDAWVSRDEYGNLCTCVNSKKALVKNAKLCRVKLKWKK